MTRPSFRRSPSRCLPPLVATSLACLLGGALAQEAGESSDPPELSAGDDGLNLPLDIEDAVRMALGSNITLEQAKVDREISEFDAIGSWGQFEWVFNADVTASRATQEGTNNFDGGQGTEIQNDRLDMTLSFVRPVTTGGRFDISWNRVLTDTDNPIFAEPDPDNPGQFLPFDSIDFSRDTLSFAYVQPFLRGAWSDAVTSSQREAEITRELQREVERQAQQNLEFDVRTRYWDLVAAQMQLEVAEASLELGERQLGRERTKLEAGVGTDVEVIQAQSEVATRREVLIQRKTAVGQAEDDLRVLLFSPDNLQDISVWTVPIETMTPLPDQLDPELMEVPYEARVGECLERALVNRSQLRQQDYNVQIFQIQHKRSLADRKALLDLTVSASALGFDENDVRSREDALGFDFPTYTAILNFSMPLGNKTASYAERSARARIRRAQLEYSEIQTTVAADVRRALRDLTYRAEAVQAAQQSLLFAQRQLQAEEAKYDEGLSTLFQVFEFQQTLTEAESSLTTARVEFAKAQVDLINVQGLMGQPQL